MTMLVRPTGVIVAMIARNVRQALKTTCTRAVRGERGFMALELRSHTSHWGAFDAVVENGAVVDVRPFAHDTDPSPILTNIPGSLRHPTRITQPMIRSGWLDRGPGADEHRGAEPFVPVSWETAIDLLSTELRRVYDTYEIGRAHV